MQRIRKPILMGLLFVCVFFSAYDSFASPGPPHDIHVSVCELKYNSNTTSFQASIKIFIDDLQRAASKEGAPEMRIGDDAELKNANDYIAGYLKKHFHIELDGTGLSPVFAGKELSDDYLAVWCYIEFPATLSGVKNCTVTNDVLMALYEDQRNIMDIQMTASHKDYMIFQPDHCTWSYSF